MRPRPSLAGEQPARVTPGRRRRTSPWCDRPSSSRRSCSSVRETRPLSHAQGPLSSPPGSGGNLGVMKQFATYVLRDPDSGSIRYIGKTKQPLKARLDRHVRDAREQLGSQWVDRTHRANWIRKLLDHGKRPEIAEIHRYATLEAVNEAEKLLIKHFRVVREDLTNATGGGDGGVIPRKPSVDDQTVLDAYRSGKTTAEIAAHFQTCKKRVARLVKAAGLTRTTWSRRRR